MAEVFTVYCAGTEYDSKSDDIIAWLNTNTSAARGSRLFFFEGPGSGEYASSLLSRQVADGARGLAMRNPNFPQKLALDSAASLMEAENWVEKEFDSLSGASLFDRIARVVRALREGRAEGGTINLAGWSRGAVTCLGVANALSTDSTLKSCAVNLFLFDPVPGPRDLNARNWSEQLSSLSANISRLAVVLMENDARDWMMPPLTAPFTACSQHSCGGVKRENISLYPLPGVHSSGVEGGGVYDESASIGAHLVSEFLLANGSPISRSKVLPPTALIDAYARLKQKGRHGLIGQEHNLKFAPLTVNGAIGQSIIALPIPLMPPKLVIAPVARQTAVPNALRSSLFFVNEHHRKIFRTAFPRLSWVIEPGLNVTAWGPTVNIELAALKSHAPNMAQVIGDGVASVLSQAGVCIADEEDFRKLLEALGYAGQVAATFGVTRSPQSTPTLPF